MILKFYLWKTSVDVIFFPNSIVMYYWNRITNLAKVWSSLQVHVLRSWAICAYCKNCFPIIWTNLVYPIFRCYTYIHLLIKVRNIYLSTILAFRGRWLWFFFKFDQIFLFKNYKLRLYIFFVSFRSSSLTHSWSCSDYSPLLTRMGTPTICKEFLSLFKYTERLWFD
jgi:hypothetical protein